MPKLDPKGDWDRRDLDTLSLKELKMLKDEVDRIGDKVKEELEIAKAKKRTNGEWADPVWFARTKACKRHMGRKRQLLQEYIATRKDAAEKHAYEQDRKKFASLFMDCAKEVLSEKVFDEVLALAKKRREEKRENSEMVNVDESHHYQSKTDNPL